MLQGLREREDPKTEVSTAAQMSVFKNNDTVERVCGLHGSNLQNKWSHSNGVKRKVVMAGYSGFATCKKLKLSGSQGMHVVFAKDDQGSSLGQIMCCYSDFDQWFQGSGVNRKLQRSVQCEEALIRFGHREVKDQVLVVKRKLKGLSRSQWSL
ncbi:hypothetical protein DY000_02047265 [Brassica cretica]|uniref:Uncharacterized protein n=1 Tax=Brassica cretica TaxID=69181 RepID=A0ABQ7F0N1_BRACR|nr:hypothetical protein DY000_02047265 [Brassica cretica]